MTLSISNVLGTQITAQGASKPEPQPKAFEKIVNDVLAKVTDPNLQGYDTSRISGQGGVDLLLAAEGGTHSTDLAAATTVAEKLAVALDAFYESDAGHGVVAAKNATIWTARFSYGTHSPMMAVLSDLPPDNKLVLNVICTPSSHYGSDETDAQLKNATPTPGSKRANFESNARTNPYAARVLYQGPNDSSPKLLQTVSFKVADPKKPEYATISPDITVDLTNLKGGKLIVEGYCTLSAGVGGYVETRQTVIQL